MPSRNSDRETLRSALEFLGRPRLRELTDAHGLPVQDRRSIGCHVDALVDCELAPAELLGELKRDELKALCRELGLDDSGKVKAEIVERILAAPVGDAGQAVPVMNARAVGAAKPVRRAPRLQLEEIEAIERRLWTAADNLRANSQYASNEYFLPVMGLVFLRHAYSRYLTAKDQVEASLPTRGGKKRPATPEDFSQRGAILLRTAARFDHLLALGARKDLAEAIVQAMESIEEDYPSLRGALPKSEYKELDDEVLASLLRSLNPDELQRASGDVFGRIYEYFLTQFADLKAHDNGEFFTPVSLVSLIAQVLEPESGVVFDPACGSGGMFVQSAHFVEGRDGNPQRLTFRGMEKNATTIRLAKMNLAVHGLEGDIQQAITYYEDPHELVGKADYVMANPPFNVDEVDETKVKGDPRLPFGLPGTNKAKKVSNGNYLWISYFYSYLNERGRAGFVMSSQASSAGRDEAKVRRRLVETGDVELMVAIRSNFFYTRTVPCELWFFDRGKPEARRDQVLMIDARHIYRQVTRKIYDFSPEQSRNLAAIVWLSRGESERFLRLVAEYFGCVLEEGAGCFSLDIEDEASQPLGDFSASMAALGEVMEEFLESVDGASEEGAALLELRRELDDGLATFAEDVETFRGELAARGDWWEGFDSVDCALLGEALKRFAGLAETGRDLVKQADALYRTACRLAEACEGAGARDFDGWSTRVLGRLRKEADRARHAAVGQLKQVRYFYRQAAWLLERFPEGRLRDVAGLVKLVGLKDIEANDWSLTPGRYVGVAPEVEDEDFDFEEVLRGIHLELEGLNAEAGELAGVIARNFEELGI